MSNTVLKILLSGAAGQISYSLLPLISNGDIFGKNQKIKLNLFDIPSGMEILKGVALELQDSCFSLIQDILVTDKPEEAFDNIDVAILLGGFPRREGMNRNDLIAKNVPIFESNGKYLNLYAKDTCKILVVANPANTNCLITMKNATKINKKNFTCLTMLDHNRAKGYLSDQLKKPLDNFNNVIIWGNHSKTQYPDFSQINDSDLNKINKSDFVKTIQYRGDEVIRLRKLSSAMSAARAISDHLRIWLVEGTKEEEHTSLGVYSNGHYDLSSDIFFSLPCKCINGEYFVVDNLSLDNTTKKALKVSEEELLKEKQAI